ncbi:MAG: ABC-F family ATP-binding cassette domain-containing protein [Parachlamydiales bacterium]
MLVLDNVTLAYGSRLLAEGVNLSLTRPNRYGIVGGNGAGKSTLLRTLSGAEKAAEGEIRIPKGATLGWLKQDHYHYEKDRVLNVVLMGHPPLWAALTEKERLLETEEWTDAMVSRIADLEEAIGRHGGYSAEGRAQTLLTGLGIGEELHERPMSALSGGMKLRVLLAQTLFSSPEILLLDEPTNYLDIVTIAWLERYLKYGYEGLLLFVSHDQDFLNNLATHILDIDYGEVRSYTGNYVNFLTQKEAVATQKLQDRKEIEQKMAKMQRFVERFRSKPSKARQAMSRQKALGKMELPPLEHTLHRSPAFQLEPKKRSSKRVVEVKGISKRFGEKRVLADVSFTTHAEEKIAVIGPNGIGKSTLLKILVGILPSDAGEVLWSPSTTSFYLSQDVGEAFSEELTLLAYLEKQLPDVPEARIRSALGAALFSQDDVYKLTSILSGGEQVRLRLTEAALAGGNTLILDEPTNHLDIEARAALAKALKSYRGNLLFVSHDRHFVSEVANRIIAITPEGVTDFPGTYPEYLHSQEDYLKK